MDGNSISRGDRRVREILDDGSVVPLQPAELKRAARETLDPGPAAFLFGGAGTGETMSANRRAFERVRVVPRVLRDVDTRSMSVEVCGSQLAAPVMFAPIGSQAVWHDQGERATARAASEAGVPYCLSTVSTASLEAVAEELGERARWFQLYWMTDRTVVESLLDRAEAAGYGAIVLTVDFPVTAWRTELLEAQYAPFGGGGRPENFVTDPAFRDGLGVPPEDDAEATLDRVGELLDHSGLQWEDLAWIRERTDLPILLKGIRHPKDARKAVDHADGIVVSNHGGRQVAGERGTLESLPEVVEAVDGRIPVLLDGGIRTGTDVFKAVALGADAVLLGRPYVYGLCVAGADGTRAVVENVLAELDLTMGLSGCRDVREADRDVLDVRL